jgi:hypothetical protein
MIRKIVSPNEMVRIMRAMTKRGVKLEVEELQSFSSEKKERMKNDDNWLKGHSKNT